MGTALNKIIKDIIIRDKNMEGFQAPYVPGFDTHGLPIELKALSSVGDKKKDISKLELRQICEKFATEHIDIMSDQFKRLDRKSTRLNSSHRSLSRMPSSA